MKTGSPVVDEGKRIALNLVSVARMQGEDDRESRLLREMSVEARQYVSSFTWCGPVLDSYFAGGVGGIFAIFFFHIQPSRRGVSPWTWIMVGDIPSAYLALDDCSSAAEAFDLYLEGMGRWVEFAREGKTGTAEQGVPPVNVPATPERADQLHRKLEGLNSIIRPFFQETGAERLHESIPGVANEREAACALIEAGGITPEFPDIPRRKAAVNRCRR